jgi:hypothetical protein
MITIHALLYFQVEKARHFWLINGKPKPQSGNRAPTKDLTPWQIFRRAVQISCACVVDPTMRCNVCYTEIRIAQFPEGVSLFHTCVQCILFVVMKFN